MVARYGQLPVSVEKKIWKRAYEELVITSLPSMILANTSSLGAISTAGSGGFLIVFLMVNLAALRLRDRIKAKTIIPCLGIVSILTALAVLVYRVAVTDFRQLYILLALISGSFIVEIVYQGITGRRIAEYINEKLRNQGGTTVIVSHEKRYYIPLIDQAILLKKGRITAIITP